MNFLEGELSDIHKPDDRFFQEREDNVTRDRAMLLEEDGEILDGLLPFSTEMGVL